MPSDILELTITDLSRGGPGIAREPSGRVVFVPFTAPGDQVRVQITEEKKHFAEGKLIEILKPSPHRQTAPCPAFTRCGGCQWQHLPYDFQWKTKVEGVKHALGRTQVTIPGQIDELFADLIWNYRNRIQLRGDRAEIGFYAPGTHQLIPIESCWIADTRLNAALPQAKEEGARKNAPYKLELEVFPDGRLEKSWNAPHSAQGFRQVHDQQNEKMKSWVAEQIPEGSRVLDLFGGYGNFTYAVQSRAKEVHCVDVSAPKVRPPDAAKHLHFHKTAILPWLFRQKRAGLQADLAILDPPRTGLGADFQEFESSLRSFGVKTVIAIGCEADTWARDVSRFIRHGWRFEKMALLDLFPQTYHVESLGLLKL